MHLDLNLLRALDALLDEGSVGGAADRLHLSQPAMSRTLARIRAATGDGILVRSGRRMVPTPYAAAVRDRVHALVEQAEAVLTPARELVLGELETVFTLRCHDAATNALAPRLVDEVRTRAPGVRLRFLGESDLDDDGLRSGRTDLEVGSRTGAAADVASLLVASESLAVVMRAGHPLTAGLPAAESPTGGLPATRASTAEVPATDLPATGALTLEDYASANHVTISRRGRLDDPVDGLLRERGLARRVIASAPTTAAALRIVRRTDAVTAVPASISADEVRSLGLVLAPFPLETPAIPLYLRWHIRNDGDPAHRWLRTLVAEILR